MQRAVQQALSNPTFRTPADCTPWVLGGLWPAELEHVTPQTASLAEYLKNDLQRIANSANHKLRAINEAGLIEPVRQSEETRVINVARAFAVLRVESTIRHLRNEPLGFQPEYLSLGAMPDEPTVVVRQPDEPTVVVVREPDEPTVVVTGLVRVPESEPEPAPVAAPVEALERAERRAYTETFDTDEAREVYQENETGEAKEPADTHGSGEPPAVHEPPPLGRGPVDETAPPEPRVVAPEPRHARSEPRPAHVAAASKRPETIRPEFTPSNESVELRLRRLVEYVARQEPGLRWAAGERADGSTLLVCDLAHGWIPPGINLPAGVELLPPGRRSGGVAALLGPTERSTTYRPGDSFTAARDFAATLPSKAVREAPPVDDLGWQLTEATHWRDGLPRLAHTMAKAGAAATGVVEAELDVLRVHLDTSRYQVLAQHPDINDALLCNCLLLAATDAIATGDPVAANYHFAWFLELSAPAASGWATRGER